MEISYIAGFFDGEGCIHITKSQSSGGYNLRVSISQRKKEPLIEIQKIFGGKIYGNGKRAYAWEAGRKEIAYSFLIAVLPFLFLKKKQAQVGLMFLEYKHTWHTGERELCRKILKILKE